MLVLLFLSTPEAFRTGAYLNQEGIAGLHKKQVVLFYLLRR
jgi:hypothetical protein